MKKTNLHLCEKQGGYAMKKIAFGLIVTMLLLACATPQKYDKRLQQWVGKQENELLAVWGRPSAEKYLNDHTKVITYTQINDWYYPMEYYAYNGGWVTENVIYEPFADEYGLDMYNQMTETEVEEYCQTSFWVVNGIITAWKWRGNDCASR